MIYNIDVGQRIRKSNLIRMFSKYVHTKGGKILDAGCNKGDYLIELGQRFSESNFVGIELKTNAVKYLKEKIRYKKIYNVDCVQMDLTQKIMGEYTAFYCIDVLEHIEDDVSVIKNLYKAISPGGIGIFHVPLLPQRRFFTKFVHQEDHARDGYLASEFMDKLTNASFRILRYKHTFGSFGIFAWELQCAFKKVMPFRLAQLLTFPLTLVLTYINVRYNNKLGNGLLVVVKR